MTTPKHVEANRRNALRSTGPRTPAGKTIVSQNAARHGLYSASPVIPGVESALAWEEHAASTVASFAPVGPVETALAERVALILWRIKRIARYERDVTSGSRERVSADLDRPPLRQRFAADTLDLARERLTQARANLRALTRFAEAPPDTLFTAEPAGAVLRAINQAINDQLDGFDLFNFCAPEIAPNDLAWLDVPDWTAGRLRRFVAIVADKVEIPAEQLTATALLRAREAVNAERAAIRPFTRQLADLRRERILPERAQLDHVIRYETHLTRQLSQTIAQLEALQHSRRRAAALDASPPTDDSPDEERFPVEQTHGHARPLRVVPAAQPDDDRLCARSDHENASPDHD
jgi:hypothetical protein